MTSSRIRRPVRRSPVGSSFGPSDKSRDLASAAVSPDDLMMSGSVCVCMAWPALQGQAANTSDAWRQAAPCVWCKTAASRIRRWRRGWSLPVVRARPAVRPSRLCVAVRQARPSSQTCRSLDNAAARFVSGLTYKMKSEAVSVVTPDRTMSKSATPSPFTSP